ncbi:preprotein translocase subunit SecY, partial [Pseudomonas sp. MWU13-2860]
VLLATFQSFGIAVMLYKQPNLVVTPQWEFYLTTVVSLVTGTMFLMWLGEQITERGIGNGISLIICAGIAAGVLAAIGKTLTLTSQGSLPILFAVVLFVGVILVTYVVVYAERGQRKVLVNYAKRQVGNRVMQGQSTHLPLKLNMAGVIPPIFASSIILFPATVLGWFGQGEHMGWLKGIADKLHP